MLIDPFHASEVDFWIKCYLKYCMIPLAMPCEHLRYDQPCMIKNVCKIHNTFDGRVILLQLNCKLLDLYHLQNLHTIKVVCIRGELLWGYHDSRTSHIMIVRAIMIINSKIFDEKLMQQVMFDKVLSYMFYGSLELE